MSPKETMEKGWKARENLDFDLAIQLLNQAKDEFSKSGDWFNITECLNHLAYTYKLIANQKLSEAESNVQEASEISKKHNTKDVFIVRAKISLLTATGKFEEALLETQKLVQLSINSAQKADSLQHLALTELRTGKIANAEVTINLAFNALADVWDQEQDPHKSIWKCAILNTKALISFNNNKLQEALTLAKESLQISKEKDLKTRILQAENLVEFFLEQT